MIDISQLAIIIVEPSHVQARIIEDHFKDLHIQHLHFCRTGAETLSYLRENEIDLVASAMYLEDMTAVDLVDIIRHDPELDNVPFMLISSETSIHMLEPMRQAGIVAILPKPFNIKDLRRALAATVDLIDPEQIELEGIDLEELRVLLVDDSHLSQKYLYRILTNLGIRHIDVASNGAEAIEYIQNEYYDLVMTDYNMPVLDGEKLTHYIREQSSQNSIPILMVTSEGDKSRLAAIQQSGVSGICNKPLDSDSLKKMLCHLLSQHHN